MVPGSSPAATRAAAGPCSGPSGPAAAAFPRKGSLTRRRGSGGKSTFTVRKVSFGVGVERVFPVHSKMIKKIEVVRKASVRRAKLYYLRDLKGKAARLKEDQG